MSNQNNTASYPLAELNRIVSFHGMNLFVYAINGDEYVPAKSIVDVIGIDWRNTKRNLDQDDNHKLYGVMRINTLKIDNLGGLKTPQTPLKVDSNESLGQKINDNSQFNDLLCIRLERVQIFLARTNTSRIRANGNISGADYLLKLQHEWADALHDYETHGIAVNKSVFDNTKQLKMLVDIYSKLTDKQQKHVVSKQIDHALGVHRSDNGNKQLDMLDQ